MAFRIRGLSPERFRPLFGLSDAELAAQGVQRVTADTSPGFPDRIELRDAEPGETLLLLNYVHQPADTPYRASHAIFVREGAVEPYDRVGEVPPALLCRQISLRAFDASHAMIDADLVDGANLKPLIERFLASAETSYLHAHYAKRGCYAALIERPQP